MSTTTLKIDSFVVYLQHNTSSLTILCYNSSTYKHYKSTISADVHFSPERVFQALVDKKVVVSSKGNDICLEVAGVLSLHIPVLAQSDHSLQLEGFQLQIQNLQDEIQELKNKIKTPIPPVVLHLSTTGAVDSLCVKWDIEKIATNTAFFTVSVDKKQIVIKEKGIYRFDIQLLNISGQPIYPYLVVAGFSLYGYGCGPNYQTANIHTVVEVEGNSVVEVRLQSGTIYSSSGVHHSLCIQKL